MKKIFREKKKKEKSSRKFHWKKLIGTVNGKWIRRGSYSLVVTAIMAAIVIAVNLVAGEIPSQYTEIDMSAQKLYTISEDTKELLGNLDEDVYLYFIAQEEQTDGTVEKLLERYEDASKHIKVENIDPVLLPNFTSQ